MNKLTAGLESHWSRSGPCCLFVCCFQTSSWSSLDFPAGGFTIGQKRVIRDVTAVAIEIPSPPKSTSRRPPGPRGYILGAAASRLPRPSVNARPLRGVSLPPPAAGVRSISCFWSRSYLQMILVKRVQSVTLSVTPPRPNLN